MNTKIVFNEFQIALWKMFLYWNKLFIHYIKLKKEIFLSNQNFFFEKIHLKGTIFWYKEGNNK